MTPVPDPAFSHLHPLSIGGVILPNNVILGPMAGVTDAAFRLLCHEQGAGLVSGEMISAKAIIYRNQNTRALCHTRPEEHPVSLQLFGSDPTVMAEAAAMLEELADYELLDINMGCPVPKIVKNGEGSALMRDPALIERIVDAVVRASKRPVTVKLRKGFARGENTCASCALAAEAGGASMVTVHGRTREEYYSGTADWDCIRQVKERLRIPVIASGDIQNGTDAVNCFDRTGCDGVMIARAAEGNPWIFARLTGYLTDGRLPDLPSAEETTAMLLRHARLLIEDKGEYTGIREMRKHAGWYMRGIPGAARIRERLSAVESYEELRNLCDTACSGRQHFF